MFILQMETYRFSLSWARLLPTGGSDNPNQEGIDYYNNLIDALLANNITPLVRVYPSKRILTVSFFALELMILV